MSVALVPLCYVCMLNYQAFLSILVKNMPSICYCYAKKKEEGAGVVVFVDLMSASPSPGQSHRSGVS